MNINEFAEKTLELFKQFECMDDTSFGCSRCPMNANGGCGCLHLEVKRKVQLWVINHGNE